MFDPSSNSRPGRGLLIVISGPSGVGKGTVCNALLNKYKDIYYSVSATTRKARPGETDGKEYHFFSTDEFLKTVEEDGFLEWAKVFENYYGTPLKFIEKMLDEGKDCILEIDVQGAMQVKKKKPAGVFIFIVPPSKEELIKRITTRGTENSCEIKRRMSKVDEEMSYIKDYDYAVVNDDVDKAVETIRSIILAERCRIAQTGAR